MKHILFKKFFPKLHAWPQCKICKSFHVNIYEVPFSGSSLTSGQSILGPFLFKLNWNRAKSCVNIRQAIQSRLAHFQPLTSDLGQNSPYSTPPVPSLRSCRLSSWFFIQTVILIQVLGPTALVSSPGPASPRAQGGSRKLHAVIHFSLDKVM